MKDFKCKTCEGVFYHQDEVVFDGDQLKDVSENNPDWSYCECVRCFYDSEDNQ